MSNLFQAATNGDPAYHALIIGVSRYTHLTGGAGPLTEEPLGAQLDQLGAAATSAVRVAMWIRDHFEHPTAGKGSIRLLVSPSAGETPLPEDIQVRNEVWDDDSLKTEYGYQTIYPPMNTEGISIDLLAIPR